MMILLRHFKFYMMGNTNTMFEFSAMKDDELYNKLQEIDAKIIMANTAKSSALEMMLFYKESLLSEINERLEMKKINNENNKKRVYNTLESSDSDDKKDEHKSSWKTNSKRWKSIS